MTPDDLEAFLQSLSRQCDRAGCPLSATQQLLLRQALQAWEQPPSSDNPLDRLSPTERRALLEFVRQQERQQRPWKVTLLNDWLQGRDSADVQFIRDRYGVQWLEQVQTHHLAQYNETTPDEVLRLKVGDRIEVTNGLWEWVQESGPCEREWFVCTVVQIQASAAPDLPPASCTIRFETGAEYEIQGLYDWNRPNWRWLQSDRG